MDMPFKMVRPSSVWKNLIPSNTIGFRNSTVSVAVVALSSMEISAAAWIPIT